jgi:hypothetical protein
MSPVAGRTPDKSGYYEPTNLQTEVPARVRWPDFALDQQPDQLAFR